MTPLLTSLLSAPEASPFAVIRRDREPTLDVLVGDVVDVDVLAGIPLDGAEVLALVPFRQVRERGLEARDDGAPIRCLVARELESVPFAEAIDLLPRHPTVVDDLAVDVSDADYAAIVRRVIGGTVSMNPISGTFRHGEHAEGDEADHLRAVMHDVKEREELVMVVDEELKMMSAVCPTAAASGGRS